MGFVLAAKGFPAKARKGDVERGRGVRGQGCPAPPGGGRGYVTQGRHRLVHRAGLRTREDSSAQAVPELTDQVLVEDSTATMSNVPSKGTAASWVICSMFMTWPCS